MRVEYISPFVQSSISIFYEFLGEDRVSRGEIHLKSSHSSIMGMAAIVGLAGAVEGRVVFDMRIDTAIKIASIINETEFSKADEMVQATIQEIANMITGRAVTQLQESGFIFDITPPAVVMGTKMILANTAHESLIIPIETDFGLVDINLSMTDKNH